MRLLVLGLVASVLSGNAERVGLPISPDRLLIPAGVALALMAGRHRVGPALRWRTVHTLMLATLAWTAWSALVHGTLTTGTGFYALLDRVAVPFALFALAPVLLRTRADRAVLARGLVVLGLYLGVTAVLEVVGPSSLVLPRYVMDPDVGISFGRARGPLVAAEAAGMVLSTCLFAAALGAARWRGAWRLLAVVAVPVTGVGVLLTLTRSVWLGTLVGVAVVVLATPALRRRLPLMVVGAGLAGAALLAAVPQLGTTITERVTTVRSVDDRSNTNAAGLRVVAAHPLTGIGWTRFLDEGTDWVRQSDDYPVTNVRIEIHNVPLARAAETGIPGAMLWAGAVVAGPLAAALRRPPRAPARAGDARWAGAAGGPRRSPDGAEVTGGRGEGPGGSGADPGADGPGGLDDPDELVDLADWRLVLLAAGAVWGVCVLVSPVPYPLPNMLLFLVAGAVARPHLAPAVQR